MRGTAFGTLDVSQLGPAVRWRERGVLQWQGKSLPFFRNLGCELLDGRWWMTFEDGRLFHPWSPGVRVVHPCAADTYTGRVEVAADTMTTHWVVTGPAKNQVLHTEFRRSAGIAQTRRDAVDRQQEPAT